MQKILKVWAIQRSLKKCAPARFPYSADNDYYVASLTNNALNRSFLVDEVKEGTVFGRLWQEERYSEPTSISTREIDDWELKVSRFYGYARHDYDDYLSFWSAELLLKAQRFWLWDRFSQTLFNNRLSFRQDRIEVLQKLVELSLTEAKKENGLLYIGRPKSIVQLYSEYFGNRIYGHPAREEIGAQFRMVVESLAASGDISKSEKHMFQVEPKALVSLSEYAQEERRHRDNVKQNKRLFWITVLIAFATAVQAFSVYKAN